MGPAPAESPGSSPMAAPRIHRLEESVVNRIAAGEVIQRPVSAVKELVENSLDAGSTSINVVVKDGGLKLIQVSDNGHGIRFEDLPILCERHTTSKLSQFEDLQTIKSMGFRGEALASMTYVAHVTVTTITEGELHGYRVSYRDGVMEHEPRPCAAVKGTQVMVENLFYNMSARRKTLQTSNDDYSKIVDLISRFSVHHKNVSFSCRKHGANKADVHTVGSNSTLVAIRSVYGLSLSRDLVEVIASEDDPSQSVFDMKGLISNANYNAKKTTMVLFINERLVECTPLKRAIEVVYAATLPKAAKPFVYMSIVLPPEHIDVNVHPTKREVSLLNQENMVDAIQNAVQSKLMSSNTERTFHIQTLLPCASGLPSAYKSTEKNSSPGTQSQKVPVNKMVRVDSLDPAGRLHAYLHVKSTRKCDCKIDLASVRSAVRQRRNLKESADLTSIQQLLNDIDSNTHAGLLDIVKHCTYIGMADDRLALLQYNTRLYLMNVVNISKELMYQQVLQKFAHFNAIQLSNPAPLHQLMLMELEEQELASACQGSDGAKNKIAEMNTELLMLKTEMLMEYFCLEIDQEGNLSKLPVVIDQYTPDMDRLPQFVWRLSNDVDWDDERNCFQAVAAVLADFYAMHPPLLPNPAGEGLQFYKKNLKGSSQEDAINEELVGVAESAWSQREWTIQHVLFPSMRLFLKPNSQMATDGTFVQIATLEKLYRVFERC
ncbi:unnamed protein product [Victoria cruziana]